MKKEFRILSLEEEKQLSKEDLKAYYLELREYYDGLGERDRTSLLVHGAFGNMAKRMHSYPILVDSEELQFDGPVIFAGNHSNIHDYYTIQEIFKDMINVLVASDSLTGFTKFLFQVSGSVLIDRDDRESCFVGINELVKKLRSGNNVFIFPESTWNIHPSKLMLPIRMGIIKVAAKSGCPIIPIVFEYVENNNICSKESEIYDGCIVKTGNPIYVKEDDDYVAKLAEVRDSLATIRWDIWSSQGLFRREDISDEVYFNHTDLKCKSLMFSYDYVKEEKYIYGSDDYIYGNYPINRVLPGRTKKLVKEKK